VRMPENRIRIGKVGKVNGPRRELRVRPEPAYADQFNPSLRWVRIVPHGQQELRCAIEKLQLRPGAAVLRLGAGVPADRVEQMAGADVMLAPGELLPRNPEALPLEALMGMAVVAVTGEELGVVAAIYSGGGNDVLDVEKPSGTRFRFPVLEQTIREFDPDAGRIYVDDLAPYCVDDDAV